MNNLPPVYRLKNGCIKFNQNLKLDFVWGLVFNDKGVYFIEIHFSELVDLDKFYNENKSYFLSENTGLHSITVEGYQFLADIVILRNLSPSEYTADFECYSYITIDKNNVLTISRF